MSVDLSVIIRTDFRKRDNIEATLMKLKETAADLNNAEGAKSYVVDTDDTFDRWCIRDIDDGHFFMELWLHNDFWHMETGFGYFQYFQKVHSICRSVYEYVKLQGEMEAWPCDERYSGNSGTLSDCCVKFEEWIAYCEKGLGKKR